MKISFETNQYTKKTPVNFGAYRPSLDAHGNREHNFYVAYDPSVYDASIEFYEASTDFHQPKRDKSKWNANFSKPVISIPMEKGGIKIADSTIKDTAYPHLAYRYKLVNKHNPHDIKFMLDNGTKTGEKDAKDKATILYTDRTITPRPLNAMLIMPDMFHQNRVPILGDPIIGIPQGTLKNHVNSLGGNFGGIIEKLPELKKAGVTKIISTPFTKDDITSHKYATQNAYQIASSFGTFEDFVELQKKLFENGIGLVADAAFVNEGLAGIHFASVMKWGAQSPFANWFYLSNPQEPITLGIFPKRNQENVGFKLVNSKHVLTQDETTKEIKLSENYDYDSTKPTYVQFFDKTLIEPSEANHSSFLIEKYKKLGIDDSFKLTNGEDTMPLYTFQIEPDQFAKNVKRVNAYLQSNTDSQSRDLQDFEVIKQLFTFANFNFGTSTSGVSCWEGNKELPKLNLHVSKTDVETATNAESFPSQQIRKNDDNSFSVDVFSPLQQRQTGYLHVLDYSANAAKYWSVLARDIQVGHCASLLGKTDDYYAKMKELVAQEKMPAAVLDLVNEEVVKNVIDGNYNLPTAPMGEKSEMVKLAMNKLPLESLNLPNELLTIFSSPYITQRPFADDEFNLTREDIAENDYENIPQEYRDVYKKFDKLFSGKILNYVIDILDTANKDLQYPLYEESADEIVLEPHAAEVVKLLVPNITKKVLEYGLANLALNTEPDANIQVARLAMERKDVSLNRLGIEAISPQQEARLLVEKIEDAMDKLMDNSNSSTCIRDELAVETSKFINTTNLASIKLAQVIWERLGLQLGWRIDAMKDVSNNDEAKEGVGRADDLLDNTKKVWAFVTSKVREEVPNTYFTGELTDLNNYLDPFGQGPQKASLDKQKYPDEAAAELALLEDANVTSFANYKYFYSVIQNLFHLSSETGAPVQDGYESITDFRKKFMQAWDGTRSILDHGPYDAIINAYNFYENHDKPRALHVFSLNMDLIHGSFVDGPEETIQKRQAIAHRLFGYMNKTLTSEDFYKINPKAVAMGDRLNKAINYIYLQKEDVSDDELNSQISEQEKMFVKEFKKANAQLAYGMYKGETYNAEAYGVRPFEIVLAQVFEQMKYNGFNIDDKTIENKKIQILGQILGPATKDAYNIYRIMSTVPGMLTEFAGHRQGASGYESKSNNLYVSNRNRINWEWTEQIPEIKEFDKKIQEVTNMRLKPEMSALADGDTIILPTDSSAPQNVLGLFRYNDRGSKVISIISATRKDVVFENKKLLLNTETDGILGGLKEGTRFVAEDPTGQDTSIYIVRKYPDSKHSYLSRFANMEDYTSAQTEKEKDARSQKITITAATGCVLILRCLDGLKNQTKQIAKTIQGFDYFSTAKSVARSTFKAMG